MDVYFVLGGKISKETVVSFTPKGYQVDFGWDKPVFRPREKQYSYDKFGRKFNHLKSFHNLVDAEKYADSQVKDARKWLDNISSELDALEMNYNCPEK